MKSQKGFGVVEVLVLFAVVALVSIMSWQVWQSQLRKDDSYSTQKSTNDNKQTSTDTKVVADEYQLVGSLRDVTMAKEVRGIQTNGESSGKAKARFLNDTYELIATFDKLPEPKNNDFYEGWIVRREPFKFISTGKLVKTTGTYTNAFSANEDFTAFDFYVLTLEPDDGDPSPADHIVEGVMTR